MKFSYGFYFSTTNSYYYSIIVEPSYQSDRYIAKIIGLPLEEYQKILESFGAILDNEDMVFCLKRDCKKAFNYLKKNYEILLALLGDDKDEVRL